MSLKASISGIRGIIGESLTPTVITEYIAAFSTLINKGPVLLGRDSRPSGNYISQLVKAVLKACGRDVVDIGIVPTPVVLFGVKNGDFAGGIIITASHNPAQWNALKLVNEAGKFISPQQFEKLTDIYNKKNFQFVEYQQIGVEKSDFSIRDNHIKQIVNFIDQQKIKKKKFKVALDTVNGAGGTHTIQLLKELECEVIPVNTEETGIFAHDPEPTPVNLTQLSEVVNKENADIGFALDPDGDRLVVAANDGKILSEELTLAFCIKHFIKKYSKSDIVINTSSSMLSETIAKESGVNIYRVPTGEIHVTEKMEAINAAIGGEGNGGVIVRELNKCRDALVGIGLILDLLAEEQKTVEEINTGFPEYFLIKKKFPANNIDFSALEKKIEFEFKNEAVDNQDGIRINLENEWVLIRKSNTEPIIRIFAESKEEKKALDLIQRVKNIIGI